MNKRQIDGQEEAMREEYDFSRGVRGKHYPAYQLGYVILVRKRDGTTVAYTSADQTIAPDWPTTT